jgi:hypothetical protein
MAAFFGGKKKGFLCALGGMSSTKREWQVLHNNM